VRGAAAASAAQSWPHNPIFQHIQHGFEQFHAANPQFAGVHYIAADTVE
jgi:hypothetical protein